MSEEPSIPEDQDDRRRFLKTCGRFAITVPPAMTILLSTSLSSKAIAKSTGGFNADRLVEAVPPAMAIMLGEADDKSAGGGVPPAQ